MAETPKTAKRESAAAKSRVHSLAKGLRVLEAFATDRAEMGLAEVARASDLDNGTAHRMLNTLVDLGYVEKIAATKRFRLTLKCLDLGFNAIARAELRALARPMLRGLVGGRIEAASLAVLDGAEAVYIERVLAGLVRLGIDVRIGSRVPIHSTAVGQAILAHLPRETQIATLKARPRERRTPQTLVALDDLLAKLDRVRATGLALSDQENVNGLRVAAAPILDPDGVPLAAISVATLAFGSTLAAFETAAREPVMTAARDLSRALHAAGSVAGRPTH